MFEIKKISRSKGFAILTLILCLLVIRKFYDYVQANRSTNFRQKFSEWAKG